jgi:hypothetical protein
MLLQEIDMQRKAHFYSMELFKYSSLHHAPPTPLMIHEDLASELLRALLSR